jgi:hypothetical protein
MREARYLPLNPEQEPVDELDQAGPAKAPTESIGIKPRFENHGVV